MKNSLIKKLLTCTLGAAFVVSGAAFAKTAVKVGEVNAEPVAVSADIQKIIDGLNVENTFKAEYVQDAPVMGSDNQQHGTVSGVQLTILRTGDFTASANLIFNTSALTYNDSMLGLVFLDPISDMYLGFSDPVTTTAQLFEFSGSGSDTVATPKTALNHRTFTANGYKWTSNEAMYYSGKGYKGNGYILRPASPRNALTNVPFNFYYDNATNVMYSDVNASLEGNGNKLLKMMNVDPSQYTQYANPFTGEMAYVDKAVATNSKFEGFTNNRAALTLRVVAPAGDKIMFTSIAGLDLTNPANAFTADNAALSTENSDVIENGAYLVKDKTGEIPAAAYVSPVTGAKIADFEGSVNVYKGTRSSKAAEYGSYGYALASAGTDTALTLIGADVDLATFTFEDLGAYTLEYVANNGDKLYVDATVALGEANIDFKLEHCSLLKNGEAVENGDLVEIGDVITVVPETGYTIFGWDSIEETAHKVKIGSKFVVLTEDNGEYKYVVDGGDFRDGKLSLEASAYSARYTVTFYKHVTDCATPNENRVVYLFKGVNSQNYFYDGGWHSSGRPAGIWYGFYYYNGERFSATYYIGNVGALKTMIGYELTMGTTHGLYKFGSNDWFYNSATGEYIESESFKTNSFVVTEDFSTKPIVVRLNPVADSAELNVASGKINLSVEFTMNKSDYDDYMAAIGGFENCNMNGVILTEEVYNTATKGRQDAYHVYADMNASHTVLKPAISVLTDRNIGGVDYKIIKLTLTNLTEASFNQNLVFGIMYNHKGMPNGGVYWYSWNGTTSFVTADMKAEIAQLYNSVISTTEPTSGNFTKVTVSGTDYYSKMTKATTEKVVNLYLDSIAE